LVDSGARKADLIALFGRNASKTEGAAPQKQPARRCSPCRRSRFGSSKSNSITYQTDSETRTMCLKGSFFETQLKQQLTSSYCVGCLYSPSCREGFFSGTSTPCLCSFLHEYSLCVTSRNKIKCRECRSP